MNIRAETNVRYDQVIGECNNCDHRPYGILGVGNFYVESGK
ncbi:MAG: hypothetical protein ABJB21_10295 [bacterium]